MKLTKNFYKFEFDSRDGAIMPDSVLLNIQKLANNLQVIRDYIGKSIYITSGYRSKQHNANVGGVKNSRHVKGEASDLTVKGLSPKNLGKIIKTLIKEGKISEGGVGIYRGFVHYDIRGYKARW